MPREPQKGSPRDRQPGGAGKPPKPPKASKPRPNPFAGLPGQIDPKTGAVTQTTDYLGVTGPKAKQRNKRKEIVRRQTLLRTSGYRIVVDGIWGPRSQAAWMEYLRRGKNILRPDQRNKIALGVAATDKQVVVDYTKQEKQETARANREQKIRRQQRRDAQLKAAILERASTLLRSPALGAKVSLRDLTEVLTDPEVDFHPAKRPAAAKAIQYHLRAKGYKIPITGKFDDKTYNALKLAWKRADAAEDRRRVQYVTRLVYESGLAKKGETPHWWPYGKMPEPEDLVKILQTHSFQSDAMFRTILSQVVTTGAAWNDVKKKQLLEVVQTIAPGSPSAILGTLGGAEAQQLWQYYADIVSQTDLMPFGNYDRAGFSEEERLWHLKRRADNSEIRAANASRISAMRAKAKVLMNSTDPDDFKKVWAAFAKVEDMKFKRFQQEIAAESKTWWGDALNQYIIAPGNFARTALVYDVMRYSQLIDKGITRSLGNEYVGRDVDWTDATAVLGLEVGVPYDGMARGADGALLFAFQLTADPINFAHPFRAASMIGFGVSRLTGMTVGKVVPRLAGGGETLGRYRFVGEGWKKAYEYNKGTWDKTAFAEGLIRLDDAGHFIDSAYGKKVQEVARRLGQTKDEMLGAISRDLKQATIHGFKQKSWMGTEIRVPSVVGRAVNWSSIGVAGKRLDVQKLLDDSDALIQPRVTELPALKPMVEYMDANGHSFEADVFRSELSIYGASFHAYASEMGRATIEFQLAVDIGMGKFHSILSQHPGAKPGSAIWQDATEAAQDEVQRVMEAYGIFLRGGGASKELEDITHMKREFVKQEGLPDEELLTQEQRNLVKELQDRLFQFSEENRKAVMPAIQDVLEQRADARFAGAKAAGNGAPPPVPEWNIKGGPGRMPTEEELSKLTASERYFGVLVHKQRNEILLGDLGEYHAAMYKRFDVEDKDEWWQATGLVLDEEVTVNAANAEGVTAKNLLPTERVPEIREQVEASFLNGTPDVAPVAPTIHPLYDDAGRWHGRQAAAEGDLASAVRKSFDEEEDVANPRYKFGHSGGDMAAAVAHEVNIAKWRLDDYVARNKAAGTLGADFDYATRIEEIEAGVKSHWDPKADGFWYDDRPMLRASNLYLRHRDEFAKRRLVIDDNGEVDMMATLAEHTFDDGFQTPMERGLFDYVVMMTTHSEKQTPFGLTAPGTRGSLKQHRELLREAVNTRMNALSEAEKAVLSRELAKHGALWRAAQETQSKPLKIAYYGLSAQLALWKFVTLALRPGWIVRNVIDNVAKSFIAGVRDPRLFIVGPGKHMASVVDANIAQLRDVITFFDEMFNTNVLSYFDEIINVFWQLPKEILSKVFKSVNIEVPAAALEGSFARSMQDRSLGLHLTRAPSDDTLVKLGLKDTSRVKGATEQQAAKALGVAKKFREIAWHITGEIPENYSRKIVYISNYKKAQRELADSGMSAVDIELEATARAIASVEHTLFDYSKISVIEDNLQVFFPFIQFWKNNTRFWVESFATKPWLNNAVVQFDAMRRNLHEDQPSWMRRYFHTEEISDALAVVPGLDEAFDFLGLGDGAQIDPMNILSFAPFYRVFKQATYGENENMPADRLGHAIFGPILDTVNEWGLGVSPFIRKPLETAGVANYRAWQRMWPQTSLLEAFGDKYDQPWLNRVGRSLERISSLGLADVDANQIADNFDFFVQQEIAGQVARGEEPDIAKAEQTIKDWFLAKNLWGYFGGMYWRRATPEDMYISKLQDDLIQPGGLEWKPSGPGERKPTRAEAKLLTLWKMRGWDRVTYESYLELLPFIESYYQGDLETKLQLTKDRPEIIRWVDGDYLGNPVSKKFIRHAHRYLEQEMFFDALEIADSLDVPYETKQAASDMFLSPELKAYWDRFRTPKKERERMIQAEAHQHYRSLNSAYFAIPEDDFEARDAFMNDHPEMARQWGMNNDPSDDYEALMGSAKADLRELYFGIVKEAGWEKAAPYLKQYPFMFEGTKAEKKVKDGEWRGGGGKWSAERQADFSRAKPHLTWFFDSFMPKVGEEKAWGWLNESQTEKAKLIKMYLDKWSDGGKGWSPERRKDFLAAKPFLNWFFDVLMEKIGKDEAWDWLEAHQDDDPRARAIKKYLDKWSMSGQQRIDFMKAKPWLKLYWGLPPADREAWLKRDAEGSKILRDYFKKYAGKNGTTQHAKDFLAVRDDLDFYGSLPKDQREAWLRSDDPRAKRVLDFFKKWGKQHQFDRAFRKLIKKYPGLKHGTPEQARRMEFWRQYFELTPDQRPLFVAQHAEDAGIFVYGDFSETYRHDREQEFMRRAIGMGLSKRQAAFLYVRPLLQFYRTLSADEKVLFARANPEIQDYFDKYASKSMTGDKKLDKQVEEYFSLPPDSFARSKFLREHPQVQDWFDKRNPAEGAMRNLLEQYFGITSPSDRADFLANHPEISEYFDRRREEKRTERDALRDFDTSDPRLAPFYEDAADLARAAEAMRRKLRQSSINALEPDTIETRRERRPAA